MADNSDDRLKNLQQDAKDAEKSFSNFSKELDKAIDKVAKSEEKAAFYHAKAAALADRGMKKEAAKAKSQAVAHEQAMNRHIDRIDAIEDEAKNLENLAKQKQKQFEKEEEQAKVEKKRRKDQAEGLRQFEKSFRMIPGIGGAIAHAFDKAADVIEEGGTGLKAMGILGKNFLNILGPAAILKAIVDVNAQLGVMHKELGVGRDAALRIREEFATIANESNSARINTEKLGKAQSDLGKELNLAVQFSGESLKNFINLTEYMGVSAKAAGQLQLASAGTGKSVDQFTEGLAGAAVQSETLYGIHLPLKDVIEGISQMQAATLASIADQPKELVKAVAVSRQLGVSFEKLRGIANGLVDFQSSITNEIEAEVLLGRDINLNKARQLAFLGKEAELGQELLKQAGSLSDYNKMLPIQQEAFAKSLGYTRDELAQVLMRTEMIDKFGDKAKKLSDEQLQNAKNIAEEKKISLDAALVEVNSQVDAAKTIEDAVNKIKVAVADMVAKASPMLDTLADYLAKIAASPLARMAVKALAVVGTGTAIMSALKAFTGVTPFAPLFVKEVGLRAGRGGIGSKLFNTKNVGGQFKKGGGRYAAGTRKFTGLTKMGKGVGIGAVASLAGMAVDSYANDAAEAGKEGLASGLGAAGGALKYGGMGAMMGSMIAPGIGTAVGAAIGGLYGGVTGYLDKQEAAREANRQKYEERQKEQDPLTREIQMMRKALENKETTIQMDGHMLGKVQENRPYNGMNKPVLT